MTARIKEGQFKLTLGMLLRNLPWLGGYMAGKKETTYEHRRALQKTRQDSAQPPEFGGLTEVDLGTSLPSKSKCLSCSTTLHKLPSR